ncbi:pickpocket protein 28-like [Culex pipiens pallens]|uniref:pickpocket protein 28-like n=1 Tax=Culex pipiens pallens TaxID=42434 RepID=UPI001952A56B|nr:pickpocket protein 28-like [Culex pipiens pallens]
MDESDTKSDAAKRVVTQENGVDHLDLEEDDVVAEQKEGSFREYLRNTSFFGIKYVFSSELKLIERLFWLTILVTGSVFCGIFLAICWKRISYQLVIKVPNEEPSPIWSIPFPAVTICGQLSSGLREDQRGQCLSRIVALDRFCEQVCWHHQCDICKSLFTETRTENGVCYSFNNVAAEELFNPDVIVPDSILSNATKSLENWSLQSGYANYGVFLKYYPRPAVDLSGRYHLKLKLKFNETFRDDECGDSAQVTIFLHNPADFPGKGKNGVQVRSSEVVDVTIKPTALHTCPYMNYYPAQSTKCYFEGKRYLRFFRTYTKDNCELECRTNYFLQKKKCVLAYMPRDSNAKLCNNSYQSDDQLDKEAIIQARTEQFPLSQYFVKTCNCLPACNYVSYGSEVTRKESLDGGNFTDVTIRFGEDHFYGTTRTIRYGLIDFVAHSGGLLALFLGVTAISVVEMIYYCTLRPLIN